MRLRHNTQSSWNTVGRQYSEATKKLAHVTQSMMKPGFKRRPESCVPRRAQELRKLFLVSLTNELVCTFPLSLKAHLRSQGTINRPPERRKCADTTLGSPLLLSKYSLQYTTCQLPGEVTSILTRRKWVCRVRREKSWVLWPDPPPHFPE